jgi:hypothetical protein
MIIKIFLSVIAVLFIAISYELHQIGDVNLYAWYGFGGLMVVLELSELFNYLNFK